MNQQQLLNALTAIAKDNLLISTPTLNSTNSGQDFQENAVWCIKDALIAAYKLGLEQGAKQERRRFAATAAAAAAKAAAEAKVAALPKQIGMEF